jgi:hypothetical protein
LEWGQKRRKKVEFVISEERGGSRGKTYVAEVMINGELKGSGRGISKKTAEQEAAQSAFRSMRSRRPSSNRPPPTVQEPHPQRGRPRPQGRRPGATGGE